MYVPPAFKMDDLPDLHEAIRTAGLAYLVTSTAGGLEMTPLPLLLDAKGGDLGTLYGHVARANPQWQTPVIGAAMALFPGPDAYISPSLYATKAATGRVVPTWNYVAVEAHGPASSSTMQTGSSRSSPG
jgi:transcriptional regulator